ncbi:MULTISPECIES: hypothetical protein [unclassified Streptomyces]|uniref:hypothetical protein n=1 Tax=unclassified Streptomyces TaxID=2593676 RepID=UPI0036ABC565
MTTWFRTYYEAEDLWLYFEADDEGCAARQAEVRGQDSRPVTAGVLVVLEAAERGATTSFGHLLPDRGCRRRLPVPPHGVALAVLFGELVAIAQPSTVAPLRLAPATA